MPNIQPLDRAKATSYARQWALQRNPDYADFEEMGGDCSNFISQILLAGGAKMNWTPDVGWYYASLKNRAAAWTSVPYLHKFLTTNQGTGPFAHEVPLSEAQEGDIIQLKFANKSDFSHSLYVLKSEGIPPWGVTVAAHSYDALDRPLSTYSYDAIRVLRIDGLRRSD